MNGPIPGPRSRALAEELKRHEAPTVTSFHEYGPVFWDRAEGAHVWDVDGNRYLDLTSAFGVASLGHSHPAILAALRDQSGKLCHAMGDVHPATSKAHLCARLSAVTFERWTSGKTHGQVFLGNSGFEAVEAALKTARLFTKKRGVIAFEGAYHGLGYGALDTTWRRDFRQPFLDQLGHFTEFVPYPRPSREETEDPLQRTEERIRTILQNREIGAILVEPFQGRGGEVLPPEGFLPMLRRLCDKCRILLIVDEIFTGFWRTGKAFAVEHNAVIPDLICLGKALTGSLPLSACVGKEGVMSAWPASKGEALHTSTFLGNPLACAAALASLKVFETDVPKWKISEKGFWFAQELRQALATIPWVREVRGIGLMIGIESTPNAPLSPSQICDRLLPRGIFALPSGSSGEVLALAPPLMIRREDLQQAVEEIAAICRASRDETV